MTKKELSIFFAGYVLFILIVIGCIYKSYDTDCPISDTTEIENVETTTEPIESTEDIQIAETFKETETTDIKDSITIETETDKEVDTEEAVQPISLGEFKLTAYCSCSKCCGKWASNRPVDENGKEIVYGSIGERLTEGYSIAVDPNVIPYRTEVVINGHTYKAQDCGGAIKGNRIDVYFESHDEALEFGIQYAEVFIMPK